jgi:ABC-type phosphate/phosphonate transport system substrate-binding protein
LDAYQQLKPGRFDQLKVVARSQPLPPTVVAYDDRAVDEATVRRIGQGLLGAAAKDKHQMTLALFHWTEFVEVPADFEQVLAKTRETYPARPTSTR